MTRSFILEQLLLFFLSFELFAARALDISAVPCAVFCH